MYGYDQQQYPDQYTGEQYPVLQYPGQQYSSSNQTQNSDPSKSADSSNAQQSTIEIEPGAIAANEHYQAQMEEYEAQILQTMSEEDRKQYEGMAEQDKAVYLQQLAMYQQQEQQQGGYNTATTQEEYDAQVGEFEHGMLEQMGPEDKASYDAMSAEEKRAYVEQTMAYYQF